MGQPTTERMESLPLQHLGTIFIWGKRMRVCNPWTCVLVVISLTSFSSPSLFAEWNNGSQSIASPSVLLDYPANDTVCVCPKNPILVRARSVSGETKKTTYYVQVAFDSTFSTSSMFSDDMAMGRDTCYAIFAPEPKSKTWYWRMSTKSNADWSEVRKIHFVFPCHVNTLLPSNDTTVCAGTALKVSWSLNGSMKDVAFTLYQDSVGGKVVRQENSASLTSEMLTLTKPGQYVWTVLATGSDSQYNTSYLATSQMIHVVQVETPVFSSPQNAAVYNKSKDSVIDVSWSASANASSYILWVSGPGLMSMMDTLSSTQLVVPIANLPEGSYALKIAALCNPSSTPQFSDPIGLTIINDAQSVAEQSTFSALFVYPNPVQNSMQVHMTNGAQLLRLSVVDALGQTVLNLHCSSLSSERFTFNTESLANNCYYLVAHSTKGICSRPFVVSR